VEGQAYLGFGQHIVNPNVPFSIYTLASTGLMRV
jgi:hypothetical protein